MTLAILQARMSSTRLPGKVMMPILGMPMIGRQIERIRRATRITKLIVATSTDPSDNVIENYVRTLGLWAHRGPLDDVLGRFIGVLLYEDWAKSVVRLTADCPLTDWTVIDQCIAAHEQGNAEITYTDDSFPKGLDVEVCDCGALRFADQMSCDPYEREHVTPYLRRHAHQLNVVRHVPALAWHHWTVDTPEDFAFVTKVYEALYPANPAFTTEDILAWTSCPTVAS